MASISREEELSRRVKVLRRILKAGGRLRWSYRQLGRSMGLTPELARAVVQRLVRDGLVTSKPCFDRDGSQRANELSVTAAGRRFYEAAPKRRTRR